MLRYFILSLLLIAGIFPFAYIRKNLVTENEFLGVFLGNYIYYSLFFFMLVLVLIPVHYCVRNLTFKQINLTIFSALLFIGGIGYYHYRFPSLVFQDIEIPKSAEVSNLRIAFISDLHLNSNSNKHLFSDAVDKINSADVDLLLIGGDVLQDSYKQVKDNYQAIFTKIRARYGAYAIMGNHEYYGNNAEENIAYVESLGFKVVRDDLIEVSGVQIVARDDKYNDGRASLAQLYDKLSLDLSKPIIVLDHNPKSIPETREHKADLQLSGHTHAGQFFPLNVILDHFYENARGYKKIGNLHTLVSEGLSVGYWRIIGPWQMPYRLGTHSEINIIDLHFSGSN